MPTGKTFGRLVLPLVAALAIAAQVSADGAVKTTIRLDANFGAGTESFTTTGGALCPAGTAHTDSNMIAGRGRAVSFHGVKTLTCEDGTGTFRITFNAGTVSGSPQDQGGWRVFDGTGAYAGISGGGNLVGTGYPGGIIDLYTGNVQR